MSPNLSPQRHTSSRQLAGPGSFDISPASHFFPLIDQPRKHPVNGFSQSQKRHSLVSVASRNGAPTDEHDQPEIPTNQPAYGVQ